MKCSVVGARGEIGEVEPFIRRVREAAAARGLEVQVFDADMVFGEEHILVAWEHALRAFERGTNVASDRMVEVILFASGERQISDALAKMGLRSGQKRIVLLVVGEGVTSELLDELGLEGDDRQVAGRVDLLPAFGITQEELDMIPSDRAFDLVIERVALAELWRG